jgi:hypothetical protein
MRQREMQAARPGGEPEAVGGAPPESNDRRVLGQCGRRRLLRSCARSASATTVTFRRARMRAYVRDGTPHRTSSIPAEAKRGEINEAINFSFDPRSAPTPVTLR